MSAYTVYWSWLGACLILHVSILSSNQADAVQIVLIWMVIHKLLVSSTYRTAWSYSIRKNSYKQSQLDLQQDSNMDLTADRGTDRQ